MGTFLSISHPSLFVVFFRKDGCIELVVMIYPVGSVQGGSLALFLRRICCRWRTDALGNCEQKKNISNERGWESETKKDNQREEGEKESRPPWHAGEFLCTCRVSYLASFCLITIQDHPVTTTMGFVCVSLCVVSVKEVL